MKIKHYKKGERIDAMSVAGEDMIVCGEFGIKADLFKISGGYQIPVIESSNIGSGKCLEFLNNIKKEFGDIWFCSIVNERFRRFLIKNDFKIKL